MKVVFTDADLAISTEGNLDNSYSHFLGNTAKLLPVSALFRKASWHHAKPQKVSLSRETLRLFENEISSLNHMQIRDKSKSILFYELTYHVLIENLINLNIIIIQENHRNFPPMLICHLLDSVEEMKELFSNLLSVFPTYLCVNDDMCDTSVIGSIEFYQNLMVSLFPDKSIFEKVCEDINLVNKPKSLAKKFMQLERDQAVEQLNKIEKAFFWKITWIPRKCIQLVKSAYKLLSL